MFNRSSHLKFKMAHRLPFLFLCLLIVKRAYSLNCFVTDTVGLQTNISAEPIIENCTDFFYEHGLGSIVGDEEDFRCATIITETDILIISLQICLASNYTCDNWINQNISLESVTFNDTYETKCNECPSELCNAGVQQTFVVKENTDLIKDLYISSASFVAIGISGVVVLVCFIKKCKKRH